MTVEQRPRINEATVVLRRKGSGYGLWLTDTKHPPSTRQRWIMDIETIEIIIWALLATAIFICLLLLLDLPVGVIVAL